MDGRASSERRERRAGGWKCAVKPATRTRLPPRRPPPQSEPRDRPAGRLNQSAATGRRRAAFLFVSLSLEPSQRLEVWNSNCEPEKRAHKLSYFALFQRPGRAGSGRPAGRPVGENVRACLSMRRGCAVCACVCMRVFCSIGANQERSCVAHPEACLRRPEARPRPEKPRQVAIRHPRAPR